MINAQPASLGGGWRPKRSPDIRALGLLLCILMIAGGCSRVFPTKIEKILADPRRYDGREVTIRGTVEAGVNLVIVRTYQVRDQTGTLLVVTDRAVPRAGTTVKVRGKVNQAFAIGDASLTVLREE